MNNLQEALPRGPHVVDLTEESFIRKPYLGVLLKEASLTLASPEVDQGTHGLNPEVDQDSRVLHLIYLWGDLLLADLLLGMPV